MKSKISLVSLLAIAIFSFPHSAFGQFGKLKEKLKEKIEGALDGDDPGRVEKLISKFEKGQPISTTFDDAIYEADFLGDLEPTESQYLPLDIQTKAEKVGYKLQSGFYTMNARSFCLRGYTHGPSKGDGHLYAPLKGKKADFVQSIIEHYAAKPEVPQQNVQVLLWAIIAGADMNTLGEQHSKTLNSLFTTKELLDLTVKGWADEYVDSQIGEWKKSLLGKTPEKLQELLDADDKIRSMVKGNKSFQEIEKVAIISGVAPRDMIREVSKGRWSYHPDGYFVRFFPNGYPQTRVDVYVPFKDAVQTDASGKAIGLNADAKDSKEVVFNPSGMVASPANRPSQRIGVSPVPVSPCKGVQSNPNLANSWKEEGRKFLMKDASIDIDNQPITCAYAKMYLKKPDLFKWAGLAAIVSGFIGKEEKTYRLIPNYIGLMKSIMKGNRAVFDDLFWQHLAFESKGISEIENLYCSNAISEQTLNAWRKIAGGNVWEGNRELLYHEQKNILQNMYSENPNLWDFLDNTNFLKSPVPNHDNQFPYEDISKFDERWKWIDNEILPSWKSFESNIGNKPLLLKALHEACPTLKQNEVVATKQQNAVGHIQPEPTRTIETSPKNVAPEKEELTGQNKLKTINAQNFSIPSIALKNMDGTRINLKSLITDDKNYLIVFWASWMGGSVRMLEDWKSYYPNWKINLNLEVVAVSFDVERQIPMVKERISKNNWTYPIFFVEDSQAAQEAIYNNNYRTNETVDNGNRAVGIPLVYICQNGKIIKQIKGLNVDCIIPGKPEILDKELIEMLGK